VPLSNTRDGQNASHTPVTGQAQLPAINEGSGAASGSGRADAAGILYGVAVFASAFLLFQVQPLIAKIILPWFGGSSSVWTTCLLFFQVVLLLGYLYAHWLTRWFRPRAQTRIHLVLLALGILVLPILPKDAWKPSGAGSPALHILLLLGATVGLPYFLLSTSSPLLQAWYAAGRLGAKPYRLFALSNAGSMLALVTYPVLVEPFLATRHQAIGWSLGFAGFAALGAIVALRSGGEAAQWPEKRRGPPFDRLRAVSEVERQERQPAPQSGYGAPGWFALPTDPQPQPSRRDQALWVALTACSSTLLLAVTSHLSQDVAAIPFLWILPLSLYLLSFILCFEGRGWYHRGLFLRLFAVAVGGMAYALSSESAHLPLALLISLYSAGLFLCCMVCHGELAKLKPAPQYLTSFYLMCSLGGALGGVFAGLLAPHLFSGYFELPIGLGSCAVLVLIVLHGDPSSMFYKARWRPAWLVLVLLTAILIGDLALEVRDSSADADVAVRNFYGTLQVIDDDESDPEQAIRKLMNGTIMHGEEFLDPSRRRQPTSYYGPNSGVGLALRVAGRQGTLRVGVIGLGAGTLAAYGRRGDRYIFYEINPLVIKLANTEFYFLKDSEASIEIVLGDARLSLERQPRQDFDVLVVDAFSGDAIPVHLLTREAFLLYSRQLKSGGVLAVHVSNRYLDLRPVVQHVTESLGEQAIAIDNGKDEQQAISRATWILVSRRPQFFAEPEIKKAGTRLPVRPNLRLWTDDYSSLLGLVK
jgi:SAM-dependent methyltransferase